MSAFNFDTTAYKSHSFRIGGSTELAKVFHQTLFRLQKNRSQISTKLNFNSIKQKKPYFRSSDYWMFGSSIIKTAFVGTFVRPGWSILNIERLNISLWWQGNGGMELLNAIQKLELLKQVGPFPNAIFIHYVGNDLGRTSVRKIRLAIMKLLQSLTREFSHEHYIWSFILPRRTWRYSNNAAVMKRSSKRINSSN